MGAGGTKIWTLPLNSSQEEEYVMGKGRWKIEASVGELNRLFAV